MDWLMRNSYEHTDNRYPTPGQFTSLISDTNKWYNFKVQWFNGHVTEFRDSAKKLPMTVRRVAQSFKLPESKGDIDYHTYRAPGHKLTNEELDYLRRDVTIMSLAMSQVIGSGMTRLTVASDSLAEYKRLIGGKMFARLFPVLDSDIDKQIRAAYRGGFTYCDGRFKGRRIGVGLVLDVNSLYPSVMKAQTLPYGIPAWHDGKVEANEEYPLTVFSVTFTAKIKPDHIPVIQIKGTALYGSTEYLRELLEPTTLMVTNVDWELYNDHYDIDVQAWGGGYAFKAARGMFDTYIDKWSKVKETSTGGAREVAKLHLNSLYGKFASNPNVTGNYPVMEDGRLKFIVGPTETRDPVYTAVGVFITSYARDLTIRAAQANYSRFAYADTDSLHLLGTELPGGLEVHPTKLGAWKLEYLFQDAFYVRAKCYIEQKESGEFETHMAGLPEIVAEKLTFDDMTDQKVFNGKLRPVSVPGGIVLQNVSWALKL